MTWLAGVDDVGSQTQLSEGWAFAILPRSAVSRIDAAVSSLAPAVFHGKEFKPKRDTDSYKRFLEEVRSEVAANPGAQLTFTLQEMTWKNQMRSSVNTVISQAFHNASVPDPNAVKVIQKLFRGLITLQRLTVGSTATALTIELDEDSISTNLATGVITRGQQVTPTARVLQRLYETYRNNYFPSSPELGAGIVTVNDADSRIVQAADVFGNFALAYIFVELGHTTTGRKKKADIFSEVFKDDLPPSDVIRSNVVLAGPGNEDIQLAHQGGLTLSIR